MIVYHGSNKIIKFPDISFSKNYLDFGKGFYITTYKNQAERWALRKCSRYGGEAIVNIYDLNDDFSSLRVLKFDDENEKWLDFVCSCRNGENLNRDYDVIIGNVADDDVFKTVDMYFRGLWDKKRTIEELRYYKMNDQICIVNQNSVEKILLFKESYKINSYD